MRIEAVLVDVGGTLWPNGWPSSAEGLYRRNLTRVLPHATEEAIKLLLRELHARDPGTSGMLLVQDTRRVAVEALAAAGLPDADVDLVLEAMDLPAAGIVEPFDHAEELLATIRYFGLKCVIVSNATYRTAQAYRRDFDSFSVGALIDGIISSVDVGYRKPHERLFLAAAAEAGVVPEHCVMIGDTEEKDILPARDLGMRTMRVAVEGQPPLHTSADFLVTSLDEAAQALRTLACS